MKLIPSLGVAAWASGFKLNTSVCDGCQRSFTLRHHSAPNIGIRMHDAWYCGQQCFTAAAEKVISRLLMPGSEPVNRNERMPLGLLLVSRGLLTKEQLKEVASEQREAGGEIGALLISRGVVTEKQVAAARATQWGCPLFMVPRHGVHTSIRFPLALVRAYAAVALHHGAAANQLSVGFVHSIDHGLLYALEHMIGCKTQASFVTPADFQVQFQLQSEIGPGDTLVFDTVQPFAAMARTLCQAAMENEADEAAVAKCKGYLWTRVKHGTEAKDLLFKTQ